MNVPDNVHDYFTAIKELQATYYIKEQSSFKYEAWANFSVDSMQQVVESIIEK